MIAVENLRFRYRAGTEELFGGLTYAFSTGRVTAVTGASGVGKSTLLYILGLMLTPTSGHVAWDGRPVSLLPDGDRSRLRAARVGFVFQDAALDPTRSVAANVAEGGLYAGLPPATIERRRRLLLDGLGVVLRDRHRPGEVSGGQAQRVALARALVKEPDILLADEPTGNLDRDAAELVRHTLAQVAASGAVVVIATHDQSIAAEAHARLELQGWE